MFRFQFFFTFLFLFIIITEGCAPETASNQNSSSDTPAMKAGEKIYANYYVRYIADDNELKAEASFVTGLPREKRTPKKFNAVRFNDSEMRMNELRPSRPSYRLERKSSYTKQAGFSFVNDKGQEEKDAIEIPQMKDFSFGRKLTSSKDALLSWDGTPLGDQESLVLLFTNEEDRTLSTIVDGPTDKSEITIPKEKLSKLTPGKNRVYIVRKNRFVINSTGSDGIAREVRGLAEYYSLTIEVEVE